MVMAVNGWDFVLLFAYISAALLLAAFLRKQFLFMQRLMIPNAIVAGLIVLLCSRLFGIMKISPDQLEITVYHLLTGIFILIGLKEPRVGKGRAIFTTTMIISQGYALLALIGCIFTSIWVGALFPKFFPSFLCCRCLASVLITLLLGVWVCNGSRPVLQGEVMPVSPSA